MPDYTPLDQPSLFHYLFYPRKDFLICPEEACDLFIEVQKDISISCRIYADKENWPTILYFHGNGEVVSDYNDIAEFYRRRKIKLIVADYRAYGASGGQPSFSKLIEDAHIIYKKVREKLSRQDSNFGLWIMGRSLGSMSALELAYHYQQEIKGLIIESGFASISRLIRHFGLPAPDKALDRIEHECLDMIAETHCPALLLHGEYDSLVPLPEGQLILENLGAEDKKMVIIPYADHNDIIFADEERYFGNLRTFIDETK